MLYINGRIFKPQSKFIGELIEIYSYRYEDPRVDHSAEVVDFEQTTAQQSKENSKEIMIKFDELFNDDATSAPIVGTEFTAYQVQLLKAILRLGTKYKTQEILNALSETLGYTVLRTTKLNKLAEVKKSLRSIQYIEIVKWLV